MEKRPEALLFCYLSLQLAFLKLHIPHTMA